MKNYLLLLFTFLLIVGCDQERKKQEFQLQKIEKELDSVSKVMETFGPDLMLKDVTIEVTLIEELPKNLPKDEIVNYIQFVEGNSGSIIGNPKDFTVIVFEGRKVKWKGKKLPRISGQKPRIDSIIKKSGEDIIQGNGTRVNNGNDLEFEVTTGLNDGAEEQYKIVISFGQGRNMITFPIDPIIKFHVTSSN